LKLFWLTIQLQKNLEDKSNRSLTTTASITSNLTML